VRLYRKRGPGAGGGTRREGHPIAKLALLAAACCLRRPAGPAGRGDDAAAWRQQRMELTLFLNVLQPSVRCQY
jgi:hypothetical protein